MWAGALWCAVAVCLLAMGWHGPGFACDLIALWFVIRNSKGVWRMGSRDQTSWVRRVVPDAQGGVTIVFEENAPPWRLHNIRLDPVEFASLRQMTDVAARETAEVAAPETAAVAAHNGRARPEVGVTR